MLLAIKTRDKCNHLGAGWILLTTPTLGQNFNNFGINIQLNENKLTDS